MKLCSPVSGVMGRISKIKNKMVDIDKDMVGREEGRLKTRRSPTSPHPQRPTLTTGKICSSYLEVRPYPQTPSDVDDSASISRTQAIATAEFNDHPIDSVNALPYTQRPTGALSLSINRQTTKNVIVSVDSDTSRKISIPS
nr:AP2-like ethylene-responsive transcription factor AIL6 [Ipomoea batatas]